ncbi:hypothetical protein DID75_00215 [Candidatus Marinamargulisbacteria bacterium SCGC AG-410-N11]|nr:hypothetical protein DID75_00215 [Candidatus Marinamargulisbacteria bacterium SCGC AG-410-N11]
MNTHSSNDELDLIKLFKIIWDSKLLILSITLFCISMSIVYFYVSPKQYKSTSSFFISSPNQNKNPLASYTSLIGIQSNSNIESLIKNVLKSNLIQIEVSKNYLTFFKNKIDKAILENKITDDEILISNYLINTLKLHRNFSFVYTKDGLFKLSYFNSNKHLAQSVLQDYIDQITKFNENLEFSVSKNILTLIDPPNKPLGFFKPNLKLNIVFSFLVGLFFSFTFVLFKYHFSSKE